MAWHGFGTVAGAREIAMSILKAFTSGLSRLWFHKRMLAWLYLVNLLFAGVLLAPFRRLVAGINRTDLIDDFAAGFQVDTFFGLRTQYAEEFQTLGISALGLGALYLLVNVYLTGGIVATLASKERASLGRFCGEAGRFFFRYLRILVVLAATLGAVGAGYHYGLESFIDSQRERANTDVLSTLWLVGGLGLVAFAASLVLMVFDYARISIVSQDRRSALMAAGSALWFCLRRPIRTVSLFYLNLALVACFFVLYVGVAQLFDGATLTSILGLFAVQQAFILARIAMRVSFFSSQCVMHEALSPRPKPAETAQPAPPAITRPPRATAPPLPKKPPPPSDQSAAATEPKHDEPRKPQQPSLGTDPAPQATNPAQPGKR